MMTIPGLALFYCRHGAQEERARHHGAEPRRVGARLDPLGGVRLQPRLHRRRPGDRHVRARCSCAAWAWTRISPLAKTIPEALFMLYQMTFAVITVALVAGSVADRMRFSAFLWFAAGWLLFVYVPIAHWVWGGGFLASDGVLDFAGGTVVHLNAGIAGLVAALCARRAARLRHRQSRALRSVARGDRHRTAVGRLVRLQRRLGARRRFARRSMPIVATHLAACAGALTWMVLEWWDRGKPSVLGMISGAVAGLGTITPASGFVLPWHGIVIGIIAGAVCYWACTKLKTQLGYDDSLDVFGVHGIGGVTGTIAGRRVRGRGVSIAAIADGCRADRGQSAGRC